VIIRPPICSPRWNPTTVSLITISARTLNKYGERIQPCRTPFLTWNHSDSGPATLTLASCFLYSLSSKSNKVQRISHVHHSYPELIMRDRVGRQLEVYGAHVEWLPMLTCLCISILKLCLHDTTGCQTGLKSGLTTGCIVYTMQPVVQPVPNRLNNRLHRVNKHSTGCQTAWITGWMSGCMNQTGWICTTGWTTGWMFVYTVQPVVKPLVKPVWQPVVSCNRGLRFVIWSLVPYLVGIPHVRLQFLFRSSLGSFLVWSEEESCLHGKTEQLFCSFHTV